MINLIKFEKIVLNYTYPDFQSFIYKIVFEKITKNNRVIKYWFSNGVNKNRAQKFL